MQSLWPLRVTLGFVFVISLYFAYVFLLMPPMLLDIYGIVELDSLHRFFAMTGGAGLLVLAIVTVLAALHPRKFSGLIIFIILYHFARLVVDIVLMAQGDMLWQIVLPEMVYFVFVCGALIRYFPAWEKIDLLKAEKEVEDMKEAKVAEELRGLDETL